jgi:hypothetical protein
MAVDINTALDETESFGRRTRMAPFIDNGEMRGPDNPRL